MEEEAVHFRENNIINSAFHKKKDLLILTK